MLNPTASTPLTFTSRKPVVDGKVDAFALEGRQGSQAVTDIADSRLEAVLSTKAKDATSLGDEWKGSYRSLPIYSNRGIIGLDEHSEFKTEGQNVHVDWHKKTVTVRTEAADATEGHQLQASFDWQRQLVDGSVQESTYLIAGER